MKHQQHRLLLLVVAVLATIAPTVLAQANQDYFNYAMENTVEHNSNSYGQTQWQQVQCNDINTCPGYPNDYPFAYFSVQGPNNCQWCPQDSNSQNCGLHRQSPIDLKRNRGQTGHQLEKDCPDWHYMQTLDDTCTWDDLRDHLTIERHALQLHIPQLPNGEIDCTDQNGERRYPRLDYSKGFPDWWWMQRIDIMVPSQHTQEGHRYAAEVTLAHFYEIDHPKNHLGHIAVFLQDYPDTPSWPYLDKLICQWRIEEEKVRANCGLPPAPPYGRCQLFRNQQPTQQWLDERDGLLFPVNATTQSPVVSPTESPVISTSTEAPVLTNMTTEAPVVSTTTEAPVVNTTSLPSDMPSMQPSNLPTAQPSAVNDTTVGQDSVPPPVINCQAYPINMDRVCHSSDPCCEKMRSDTTFCWQAYDLFGDNIYSACHHCCDEPKTIGPPTSPKPELPKTIQCSSVVNPHRMCKPNSCCSNPRSQSDFCLQQYALYANILEEICYYCCSEPQEPGPPVRRSLRSLGGNQTAPHFPIPSGAKVTNVHGVQYTLGPENLVDDEDEDTHFNRTFEAYRRRSLQNVAHSENYEDIDWAPYEWLMKVETEYYYRYEGSMLVPPCWQTVHWRPMKDPIRVHERQIAELHRLLAWRHDPDTCQPDTAGVVSEDGNRIKLNRETQYYHLQHRKVFCECKDWPSKFEGDREWCDDWRDDVDYFRFYEHPYSFASGWDWLPSNP